MAVDLVNYAGMALSEIVEAIKMVAAIVSDIASAGRRVRAVPAVARASAGLFFPAKKCDNHFGFPSNRWGLFDCRTLLKLLKSFRRGSPVAPAILSMT